MAEKKQMTTQNMLVALLVVAALVIGYLYGQNKSLTAGGGAAAPTANDQPAAAAIKPEDVEKVTAKDHIRGDLKTAKVALIEYSDFECPYCSSFHTTAMQAAKEYGKDVVWVYRHFPLTQLHPNATPYALASECVADDAGNDAFWSFGDVLFEKQQELAALKDAALTAELTKHAINAGANKANFTSCYTAKKFAKKVDDQYQTGVKAGVTGTPGNIIMNLKTGKVELIAGAVDLTTLKTSIDAMMK